MIMNVITANQAPKKLTIASQLSRRWRSATRLKFMCSQIASGVAMSAPRQTAMMPSRVTLNG